MTTVLTARLEHLRILTLHGHGLVAHPTGLDAIKIMHKAQAVDDDPLPAVTACMTIHVG